MSRLSSAALRVPQRYVPLRQPAHDEIFGHIANEGRQPKPLESLVSTLAINVAALSSQHLPFSD